MTERRILHDIDFRGSVEEIKENIDKAKDWIIENCEGRKNLDIIITKEKSGYATVECSFIEPTFITEEKKEIVEAITERFLLTDGSEIAFTELDRMKEFIENCKIKGKTDILISKSGPKEKMWVDEKWIKGGVEVTCLPKKEEETKEEKEKRAWKDVGTDFIEKHIEEQARKKRLEEMRKKAILQEK